MKIPTRPHTIVFGQRNHERLPHRNKRTMPRVSASGKMAAIKNVGSPDWHIMTAQPKTTSATYVHPRASTILTGSGFFISGTVYQKLVRSELENYTAIIRCQHFVIFGLYLARLEVDPATNANQTMKRTEPAKRNCRHPVLDRHRRSEVFPA